MWFWIKSRCINPNNEYNEYWRNKILSQPSKYFYSADSKTFLLSWLKQIRLALLLLIRFIITTRINLRNFYYLSLSILLITWPSATKFGLKIDVNKKNNSLIASNNHFLFTLYHIPPPSPPYPFPLHLSSIHLHSYTCINTRSFNNTRHQQRGSLSTSDYFTVFLR